MTERGTGVWVVESGCKYDNCGDITRHGSYDNEAAARAHGDWLDNGVDDPRIPEHEDVRVFEITVPGDVLSEFIPPDTRSQEEADR